MNQGQPITGICITYKTIFGDSISCTIAPNGLTACSLAGTSACGQ